MSVTLTDAFPTSLAPIFVAPASAGTITGRVLHVINGEHYSGAERVQDLLAGRLPQSGFEVAFACLKPGRFETMRSSRNAHVINVPMGSRLDLQPARKLARLVRSEGFSLMHTHTPRAALVGAVASKLSGVPLVHHVHSPTSTDSTRRTLNRISAA